MNVFLLILFGGGLIIYSAIGRWEKLFVIAQVLTAAVFLALGVALLKIGQDVPRGLALGTAFMIVALAPRLALRPRPREAGGEIPGPPGEGMPVRTIDFVWLSLMATALAFAGFALHAPPFADGDPPPGRSVEYYQTDLDISQLLFTRTVDAILLLGGALAAAMAILWAGEIWRKGDEMSAVWYRLTTRAAIKMVIAFFIIALSTFIWVALPLYDRMGALRDALP